MAQGKLGGKNIILTGASRGFGAHLAQRLWEEGATLLLLARRDDPWPSLKEAGHFPRPDQAVKTYRVDLRDTAMIQHVMEYAFKTFRGHIDCLINNAAVQGPVAPTWDTNWRDWNETLTVNLHTPVELCRQAVTQMLKNGHGKIVNLSGGGATNPRPNYTAYATAKAGLVRFSECLAEELRSMPIDVNCVAPGKMATGMLPEGESPDDNSMEKAADLIIFLLSDESNGITGKLINAIWDPWATQAFRDRLRADHDFATLRRADL